MSLYGRFEQIVTWILTLFIAVIIAVALFRLIVIVLQLLVSGALNPLGHEEFELIFGTIMTLLIAMEFNHSIQQIARHPHCPAISGSWLQRRRPHFFGLFSCRGTADGHQKLYR